MINLFIYDKDLLPVLYPDYDIRNDIQYGYSNVIYTGKVSILGDINAIHYYAYASDKWEESLIDRASVTVHAYVRKHIKSVPKSVLKHVEKISNQRFVEELRMFMAVGKWQKESSVDVKVYELFSALSESKKQFLTTYFALRQHHNEYELWSSILTFLIRVVNFTATDLTVSDYYKKVILTFQKQTSKIKKVVNLLQSNHHDELTIINTLLGIR